MDNRYVTHEMIVPWEGQGAKVTVGMCMPTYLSQMRRVRIFTRVHHIGCHHAAIGGRSRRQGRRDYGLPYALFFSQRKRYVGNIKRPLASKNQGCLYRNVTT